MCVRSWKEYLKGREEVLEKLGGCCELCGLDQNLHIHHIKPIFTDSGRGSWQRLKEWRKNMRGLQLLCKDCHKKVHERL